MNAKTKLAAGVIAGLIAGAALMGAAIAVPASLNGAASRGFGMMGRAAAGNVGRPTIAEMQSFMGSYRTPSGGIDMNRMHADVTSGKVTPPCLDESGATDRSTGRGSGYGMMGNRY